MTSGSCNLKIPRHIAIIMDGNGRWAKKRMLPRAAGHKKGVDALREIVKACNEIGVKHLTVYAFSTENWARPKEEVTALMNLFMEAINNEIKKLHKNDVRIRFLGRIDGFSKNLKEKMVEAMELTKNNKRGNLNVMVNYGGRAEIIDAIKKIIDDKVPSDNIDETIFSSYLYTAGIPDPDLLIRTADEMRISNYLLWQIAYSEIYITKTLWPDFDKKELIKAIEEYSQRERKFGKTSEQIT
ncbi:MAG: undecaprenyl diphosphate synthase [Candidatus Saganbacteria bacterium]|uniref:Isoprenyl transferase n=1 Tax=Candidatus Saganbacteria bacterium TaxID=2575572 RepID=A0A833L0U1_UNCSA|nr:MAG: undecaprenyl diphosphate synthase [Candidatus Saganbacteria bacterium]